MAFETRRRGAPGANVCGVWKRIALGTQTHTTESEYVSLSVWLMRTKKEPSCQAPRHRAQHEAKNQRAGPHDGRLLGLRSTTRVPRFCATASVAPQRVPVPARKAARNARRARAPALQKHPDGTSFRLSSVPELARAAWEHARGGGFVPPGR